jgi:hypothetical protein
MHGQEMLKLRLQHDSQLLQLQSTLAAKQTAATSHEQCSKVPTEKDGMGVNHPIAPQNQTMSHKQHF